MPPCSLWMPPNIIRDLSRGTKGHYSMRERRISARVGCALQLSPLITCLCAISGCNLHLIATVAGWAGGMQGWDGDAGMGWGQQHQRGEGHPSGRRVEWKSLRVSKRPKYSGVSPAEVSIGGRARMRRKLLGWKDTLEWTTEHPPKGYTWEQVCRATGHWKRGEDEIYLCPCPLKKYNFVDLKHQGKGRKTELEYFPQTHLGKSLSWYVIGLPTLI